MTEYIEFKKKRELGDVLSDTFAFLRSQLKPFFTTFLKIVGPYLLVLMICLGFYMYYAGNIFNNILTGDSSNFGSEGFATIFVVSILYLISLLLVFLMSQSTVLHYIKSYSDGYGEINFDEIKSNVYKTFGSFLGLSILFWLSVGVGWMLCLIPGIYLYVPLSLSFSIMVFDNKGAGDAYSDGFNLVKEEWWITFATMIVVFIIYYIANLAFSIPGLIYQQIQMGITSVEMDIENMTNLFQDPIYLILNIISQLASFLLNLITVVAGALIYFNLNEKKNFTGTFQRIKDLGGTSEN